LLQQSQVTRKGNATLCSLEADHMPFLMPANAHPVFHEARAHGGKDAGRSVHRADLQPFSGRNKIAAPPELSSQACVPEKAETPGKFRAIDRNKTLAPGVPVQSKGRKGAPWARKKSPTATE
ncbi:hypothetical protein, partial [Mesorhizobium sp.]|uniref:hypothetical protein n=1 Tax=Mesorhizobium sp. TaxID=1871066 RepID=UPI00257A63DE